MNLQIAYNQHHTTLEHGFNQLNLDEVISLTVPDNTSFPGVDPVSRKYAVY